MALATGRIWRAAELAVGGRTNRSKSGFFGCSLTHSAISLSVCFLTSSCVVCGSQLDPVSAECSICPRPGRRLRSHCGATYAVVDEPDERLSERLAADLAVQGRAAVVDERTGELHHKRADVSPRSYMSRSFLNFIRLTVSEKSCTFALLWVSRFERAATAFLALWAGSSSQSELLTITR